MTIFGQSAGAQSVFVHLMSSKTVGMFRAAIVESAPFAVPYRTKTEALLLTRKVSEILRCRDADVVCLRNKTTDEVNDAEEKVWFKVTAARFNEYLEPIGPIIDGDEIVLQPMAAARVGKFQKVPVIMGTVSEEGRLFVYGAWNRSLDKTGYEAALVLLHPTNFRQVEAEYPAANVTDFRGELSQVVTDYLFTCATRNVSEHFRKHGNKQTYLYVFDHATVARGSWGNSTFCEGHVCHAEELGYVFQNQIVGNKTRDEEVLSEVMEMYWTNFAHTMNPNEGWRNPRFNWPQYSPEESSIMYFKTPQSNTVVQYRPQQCTFWDKFGYDP